MRGLAIGRSIADVIEESAPKPRPRAKQPFSSPAWPRTFVESFTGDGANTAFCLAHHPTSWHGYVICGDVYEALGAAGEGAMWSHYSASNTIVRSTPPAAGATVTITYEAAPEPESTDGDLRSITITRDKIEATSFGDVAAQYISTNVASVHMELWAFANQSPYYLDAVLGDVRYRGTIHIDEVEVRAAIDDVVRYFVRGQSSDIVAEAV